ncbi:MAG: murein hydrolase activator EnvC family protein [Maricaulaceae bacterium]
MHAFFGYLRRFYGFTFIGLCAFAQPSSAQNIDPSELGRIAAEQAAAQKRADKLKAEEQAIRKEIRGLNARLKTTAQKQTSIENKSKDIERRLGTLSQSETEKAAALEANKTQINTLLAALQRLQYKPPPAAIMTSENMADSARTAMMLSDLTTQFDRKSKALADDITALNATRLDISFERAQLTENEKALETERETMRALITQKNRKNTALSKTRQAEETRITELASKATSLKDLIESIEKSADALVTPRLKPKRDKDGNRPKRATPRLRSGGGPSGPVTLPQGTKRFAEAKSDMHPPVPGTLVQKYGGTHKGLTVETRSGAQVLAPYTGRVEFAGDFKNYEKVVILNVGDGYFLLLTGLGDTFVTSGENITKGTPLGEMPKARRSTSNLYIEIRKNGSTINPTPWLGKVFARPS